MTFKASCERIIQLECDLLIDFNGMSTGRWKPSRYYHSGSEYLGVTAIKGYSTFRSPELKSHHQMQFCVFPKTLYDIKYLKYK